MKTNYKLSYIRNSISLLMAIGLTLSLVGAPKISEAVQGRFGGSIEILPSLSMTVPDAPASFELSALPASANRNQTRNNKSRQQDHGIYSFDSSNRQGHGEQNKRLYIIKGSPNESMSISFQIYNRAHDSLRVLEARINNTPQTKSDRLNSNGLYEMNLSGMVKLDKRGTSQNVHAAVALLTVHYE